MEYSRFLTVYTDTRSYMSALLVKVLKVIQTRGTVCIGQTGIPTILSPAIYI